MVQEKEAVSSDSGSNSGSPPDSPCVFDSVSSVESSVPILEAARIVAKEIVDKVQEKERGKQ